MTPALKAMVEAMAAELETQAGDQREGGWVREPDGEPGFYLQGIFDLEKVARAGLAAVRPLDRALFEEHADSYAQIYVHQIEGAWEGLLDAILKEQP